MAKITSITQHQLKTGRILTPEAIMDALQLISVLQATDDITQELNGVMACWASEEDLMDPVNRQPLLNTAAQIIGNEALYNLRVEIGRSIDLLGDLEKILDGMIEPPKAQRLEALQAARIEHYKEYAKKDDMIIKKYMKTGYETLTDLARQLEKMNQQHPEQ